MTRQEFDALLKELSEDVLAEYQVLQDPESFWHVLEAAQALGATKVVDISRKGYANLCFWQKMLPSGSNIVGVCTDSTILSIVGLALDDRSSTVNLFMADPSDQATCTEVRRVFSSGPADFLCLDGLGAYETIKEDFEMYQTSVRPGGRIAICNLNHPPTRRFWTEIPYPKHACYGEGIAVGIVSL